MSGQPSLSKSPTRTPSPYVPFVLVMPAFSDTSTNVPSPLFRKSAFTPPVKPGGPQGTVRSLGAGQSSNRGRCSWQQTDRDTRRDHNLQTHSLIPSECDYWRRPL